MVFFCFLLSLLVSNLAFSPQSVQQRRFNNLNRDFAGFKSKLFVPKRNSYHQRSLSSHSTKKFSDDSSDGIQDKYVSFTAYVALSSLLFASLSNQWSRQAINYLCDFSSNSAAFKHINTDLNFSQSSFAALSSIGFTGIFILASFFAGKISDTSRRNVVIAMSCIVSSIATAGQGAATSFNQLVPLRAIIGASQAFLNPAAFTLLAEYFPPDSIGRVNGIFSSGIYLGGGLASLSLLIDDQYGWRVTLFLIAAAGVAAAFVNLIFLKDPRDMTNTINKSNIISDDVLDSTKSSTPAITKNAAVIKKEENAFSLSEAFSNIQQVLYRRETILLLLASFIRFCAGFTIGTFKAPFVLEKFPSDEFLFSSSNAFIVAVGGLVSSLLGGVISDYVASTSRGTTSFLGDRVYSRSWVAAIGSLLAAPLWAAFVLAPNPESALGFLLLEYLVAECWIGPTLAALFAFTPNARRGTAQSLFSIITALGSVGPILVGALTEGTFGMKSSLADVLIYVVCGAYIVSGGLFAGVAVSEDKSFNDLTSLNKK